MTTETPSPGGQPPRTAPGKPASRQPTEDNVGEDQKPLEQDVAGDIPTDDDEDADGDDEDQTGTIELPGEGGTDSAERRDRSRPAGNP
jgi:hypothetical protein